MNKRFLSKRTWMFFGILLIAILILSLFWGGSSILAGVGLLLVLAGMFYLKGMENISENAVSKKIKTDYPSESQAQVFAVYEHLKIKELEGLFLKILDESNGDVEKVQKLATIAESVGWKAFLENHW